MSLYRRVLARGLQHVRGCPLCQARGHLCTVCRDDRVIFPFTVRSNAKCCHLCEVLTVARKGPHQHLYNEASMKT